MSDQAILRAIDGALLASSEPNESTTLLVDRKSNKSVVLENFESFGSAKDLAEEYTRADTNRALSEPEHHRLLMREDALAGLRSSFAGSSSDRASYDNTQMKPNSKSDKIESVKNAISSDWKTMFTGVDSSTREESDRERGLISKSRTSDNSNSNNSSNDCDVIVIAGEQVLPLPNKDGKRNDETNDNEKNVVQAYAQKIIDRETKWLYIKCFVLATLWFTLSASLALYNKAIFSKRGFPAPLLYTSCQFFMQWVC